MQEKKPRKPVASAAPAAATITEAMLAPTSSTGPIPEVPAPATERHAPAEEAPLPAPAIEPEIPAPVAAAVEPMVAAAEAVTARTETVAEEFEAKFPATPNLAPPVAAVQTLKGFLKMATAPEMTYAATDKMQSMFGDVNERAKTAVEKTSKIAEEMTEFTKGNVEAFVASGRVAAKGAEAMTQEVAEYGKKSFESATGALKSFAAVKSPTELFQLQSEFAKSSFESMVAEASKVSESMLKLMGEIAQPLSSRYAVAAEKMKTASSF